MQDSTPQKKADKGMGLLGILGLAIGGGSLLFALVGVVNTAWDLELVLRYKGQRIHIPDSYDVCAGLAAVGVLLIGLTFFGSFVTRKFREAKGRPFTRVSIIVAALGLLFLAGRGLQVVALTQTYGSMLAYYATDGDLEDVKAELAKGASHEDLDQAVSRAAQYDNVEALKLLLEAGADFRDETSPEDRRWCALKGVGLPFLEVAVAHGVTPAGCPNSDALIWERVKHGQDDAETAKIVTLLAGAGWSTTAVPEVGSVAPPAQLARQRKMMATLAALGATAQR